jgi:hypothetical protein
VLGKRLALLQRVVPAFHLRQRRALDFQFEISIERRADGDVRQRQRNEALKSRPVAKRG